MLDAFNTSRAGLEDRAPAEAELRRITIHPDDVTHASDEACVLRFAVIGIKPLVPIHPGDEGWVTFRGKIRQWKGER
ncbi:hypothetical protein [Methylobacterium sp. GXF4]|uniref:hypothetical protein n=1 Tax=Methylobacterium sp. GXF4 TaxID=1096546 RepID=UPI000FFE35F8|nr:hypothetical protein [Methylobacterium sp. GXF4]